jgi:hypothetical protein
MSSYLTTSAAASTYYLQTNPSGYLNTTDIGGGSAVAGADILDALQESNAPSTENPYATQGDVYTQVTSMSATLLAKSSNLSDLASASLARGNLGLGTAATFADTAFLKTANNLSDVTASTARTNLGLGTAAVEPATKLVPAGGTTGQVLVKNSGTDWDDGWATVSTPVKAWVNFNGTGTVAIRASFNVTSITDNGTGDYTVNFTTAMADVNYVPVISMSYVVTYIPYINTNGSGASSAPTTSAFRMAIINTNGSNVSDAAYVSATFFR